MTNNWQPHDHLVVRAVLIGAALLQRQVHSKVHAVGVRRLVEENDSNWQRTPLADAWPGDAPTKPCKSRCACDRRKHEQ